MKINIDFELVIAILLAVFSVGCFVIGCVVSRYYDGTGGWWLVTSVLLMVVDIIVVSRTYENDFFVELGVVSLVAYLFIFCNVKYHLEPRVTNESQVYCTTIGGCYHELKDTRVFCSPTDSSCVFTTITKDTVIHRSSVCSICGRDYDDHYVKVVSESDWVRKIHSEQVVRRSLENPAL